MLDKLETEVAAIVGVIAIAIISLLMLGLGAKEIVLGIGMGLVGFIRGKSS